MARHTFVRRRALRRGGAALAAVAAVVAGLSASTSAGAADAPTPIQTDGVWGIDFAGGTLNTVERAASGERFVFARQVSPDGLSASARTSWGYAGTYAYGQHLKEVPCDAGSCVVLRASGNGNVGHFFVEDGKEYAQIHTSPDGYHSVEEPGVTGARFVDVSGRYYAYNATSTSKQYVDDVEVYRTTSVRMTRSIIAASIWGSRLYTPGSTTGSVTSYDLEQKKVIETLATGAPCPVKELQAVGRWIYWNCGPTGAAGVYDRSTKTKITVPSGLALVGDGYLVRHDRTTGKLLLTDFHTGSAAAPREIADLPAGNTADQRRLTWAVDRFGGDIAYVGQDNAIRIVPSGVPSASLAKTESELDDGLLDLKDTSGGSVWSSTWQLNKPANWTFTVKDALGRTARTIRGGPDTEVDLIWDGKTNAGTYVYSGMYSWTLTATAAEGAGTYTTSGKISVGGGRQGFHDQGGYAFGELATLNSSGGLTLHYTSGKGTFDSKRSASGWPAGTVAVPFGDMGSDRCSEMLVRMPNGELRRYSGHCGSSYSPSSSHTSLGTGWNAYNVLVAPGDLTGDGRTDLLARKASTGDIYVFANDGHGKLAAGKKIRTGWTAYTKIVGAGDLNGDGFGDVLARHKDGTLYRYDGLGNGLLKERVKLYSNWGASYNAIVGVGDITGDGKNDLVVRDTAGGLYRNAGYGNGSFAPRVKIASGWQGYKGLF
ncbi:FG-GAP-like repeat-containing protein [Streptomyces himalayensis]|uniref:VCBS repeat-containing protein n=1 Tax=Streptomyces himalayensis subsp. himalayensis TaxID=2756131 RepID=A0A7W0DRN5_9ACTN|nr:FG-GAP-like repeat-containing protein [Streptomyces himalayensis]MBA2950036.1 VCBS repeat-containing protein [Streptomyces himalayensis subsp. himalayensis]